MGNLCCCLRKDQYEDCTEMEVQNKKNKKTIFLRKICIWIRCRKQWHTKRNILLETQTSLTGPLAKVPKVLVPCPIVIEESSVPNETYTDGKTVDAMAELDIDGENQTVKVNLSPVMILNNYYLKEKFPVTYRCVHDENIISGPPPFLFQATCRGKYGYGRGPSKRLAKQNAAADLLQQLNL